MSKQKQKIKTKKPKEIKLKPDFLEKLNQFFDSKGKIFFWISLFFTLLFSFLLFNFNVSDGGDDSTYILRAFEFVNESTFPSLQGPLYTLFLSIFVWIFGLNIILLKSLSLVSILFHLYFFYRAFKGRVSGLLLVSVMLIVSFNAFVLYYASQTYSEAFFLFLQAGFFLYFFNAFVSKEENISIKDSWGKYLILGMLLLFLGLTRSIGYGAFIAVIIYFGIKLQWKSMVFTTGAFVLEFGMFNLIKKFLFHSETSQFSIQLNRLMQVDSYDISKGQEDFAGFIERFVGNSNLYLSNHFFKFIGFRPGELEPNYILTVLVYIGFFIAFYFAFKKNKYLLFTGIYLTVLIGITFVIVQTYWDQERLILAYFPLILLFLFSGFYYLAKSPKFKILQGILPLFLIIIFFTNLNVTSKKVKANDEYLMKNLAGNKFYGMTPDRINYIKMSEWAAKNIPDSVMIACRKPSISFVYAKRKFYGIYRVKTKDPDELLKSLKDANVKYVIMGNLRSYHGQKTHLTLNAVKRYLHYIFEKYPEKIREIHRIGADEPAFLFKIIY